jgi:hypothetical protein
MHHPYESFERSELVMKPKGDLDQLKKWEFIHQKI